MVQKTLRILRLIGIVLAGLLTAAILAKGTDAILRATRVFPPWGPVVMDDHLLILAAAYRSFYIIAGSYLTARLAPDRPMMYALILGAVQVMIDVVVAVSWAKGAQFLPRWYPLALILLAMPCAWVGARLLITQLRARPAQ
ncbi:MAG: hypothetical protein LAP21_26825 [Acidobacteriia bacterium]|nr:hypothetical protein [Terriglobia bacterium]